MNYYGLKSLLGSQKKPRHLSNATDSFSVVGQSRSPYVEPQFEKVLFESESPTIILVSAVGATGKTALARQLSRDLQLPVLDLAKHKPVGDNTLTGLLTHAYNVADISDVFTGLATGEVGIIIDGVDEGRAKTTERAFEAFLDDVATLCKDSPRATILMLGRSHIADNCWDYLSGKGVSVGLITISPFSLGAAREYVDRFTTGATTSPNYVAARDAILDKLSKAFAGGTVSGTDFLSFIGYPPVLDAIATLLSNEPNYYKLLQSLETTGGQKVEVSLLNRIAEYILRREKDEKVVPNILNPILEDVPEPLRTRALNELFSTQEQAERLIAHCLGRSLALGRLNEPVLDDQYEARLATFLPEHPLLDGRELRNAVFEAVALSVLIVSGRGEDLELVEEYVRGHKHSYYLVYMLDILSQDRRIPSRALGSIVTAAMEFRAAKSLVEVRIGGPEWETGGEDARAGELEVEIEITLGEGTNEPEVFEFRSEIAAGSRLSLGSRIGGTFISVPCPVEFTGPAEVELTAPVEVTAPRVIITARSLILRPSHRKGTQDEVLVEAGGLNSTLESIVTNGVPLAFILADTRNVAYPTVQYVEQVARPLSDPLFLSKYFRLKRILLEFRSHSRGALARYQHKIESERVLKNEVGRAVLAKLVADGVLVRRGSFYFLEPDHLSAHVGASWEDLRKGRIPERLVGYIKGISTG